MSALAFDDAALEGLTPSLGLSGASDIDTALLSDIDGASRPGERAGGVTGARCTAGGGLGAIPALGAWPEMGRAGSVHVQGTADWDMARGSGLGA